MHDAVNAITREYERYNPVGPAPIEASPNGAAIAAARRAIVGIVGESPRLASTYAASLQAHGVGPDDPGLAFGDAVATGILELRGDDAAVAAGVSYVASAPGAPGVWTATGSAAGAQALLPGWGRTRPWVLSMGSQFRPEPPPRLDSDLYTRDYAEVLRLGALDAPRRTDDQTAIARFWTASPATVWNPILQQAVNARRFDLSTTARVMALFYLAAADASIACWDAKYAYAFWRPQAAIAGAALDGNETTAADSRWQPLVPTPPHPEYPSAHAANSGAMAFVLASVFGDRPGFAIEATSPADPRLRRWHAFSEGLDEVIDAHVYSGSHFRTADEIGARLGQQVAAYVISGALRPRRDPSLSRSGSRSGRQ
jgi:hypothetical protein